MATQVLPGLITEGVRVIASSDFGPQIDFDLNNHSKAVLTVVESGNSRSVPISKKVAEILIAHGMSSGS